MWTDLIVPVIAFALIASYAGPVAKVLEKMSVEHLVVRRFAWTTQQQRLRPIFVRVAALFAIAALCVTWYLRR